MNVQSLSCVRLFVNPRTVAHQAPLSMEFSRQEYWSGLSFPTYSRGSSQPRDQIHNSCISCTGRWILYHHTTWEAHGEIYVFLYLPQHSFFFYIYILPYPPSFHWGFPRITILKLLLNLYYYICLNWKFYFAIFFRGTLLLRYLIIFVCGPMSSGDFSNLVCDCVWIWILCSCHSILYSSQDVETTLRALNWYMDKAGMVYVTDPWTKRRLRTQLKIQI